MRAKQSSRFRFYLTFFLFLVFSCVSDLDTEWSGPPPATGGMDVSQAKSFFDKMGGVVSFPLIDVTPGEIETKSLSNTISPLWDKSQQVSSKRYDAVQILLSDGNSYAARTYFVDHDGKIAFEKSQWFSYLVVARDKQGDGVAAFVATIIPTKEYSMDLTKQLRKVSFDPVGSDYSGMVLYSTTKGKYLSGRSFEEGRLVGHIKRGRSASGQQAECDCGAECNNHRKVSDLVLSSSELGVTDTIKHKIILCLYQPQSLVLLRALCPETGLYYSGEMCPVCNVQHEEMYVVEVKSCPGCRAITSAGEPCLCCTVCQHEPGGHDPACVWYRCTGCGAFVNQSQPCICCPNCATPLLNGPPCPFCGYDPVSPQSPGGGGAGGGSGGFSPSSSAPNAYRVFRGNLSESQWQSLENWVKEMRRTCLGNTLYLQASMYNTTYNISFAPGINSSFSASGGQMSLELGELSYSGAMFHEMFHGYVYKKPRNGAGAANEEIEAYYAQYLYDISRQNSGPMAKYDEDGMYSTFGELPHIINSQGDLRSGVTQADLASFLSGQVLSQLRTLGYSESSYPFVTMPMATDNFSFLKSISTFLVCP